jgi:macrolide transport system ATP-binding/permease protein
MRVLSMVLRTALLAGHLMSRLLYQVSDYHPLAFLGATIVLETCATVAGFIPARRAASIDPMRALRSE